MPMVDIASRKTAAARVPKPNISVYESARVSRPPGPRALLAQIPDADEGLLATAIATNRMPTKSSPLPKNTVAKNRSSRSPDLVADDRDEPQEHDPGERRQVEPADDPCRS